MNLYREPGRLAVGVTDAALIHIGPDPWGKLGWAIEWSRVGLQMSGDCASIGAGRRAAIEALRAFATGILEATAATEHDGDCQCAACLREAGCLAGRESRFRETGPAPAPLYVSPYGVTLRKPRRIERRKHAAHCRGCGQAAAAEGGRTGERFFPESCHAGRRDCGCRDRREQRRAEIAKRRQERADRNARHGAMFAREVSP